MVNALKLARTMREAGMPEQQAEALAEALDETMRETLVTRDFLSGTIADVRTDIANVRTEMANLKAELVSSLTNKIYGVAVGIVVATGLIQHFVK